MLRFGPDGAPVVIVALPLFEEANRTRALAATLLRALADRGIAGVLPDLPGQGDSLTPTAAVTLATLRVAYAALARTLPGAHAVGIRSGALLDARAKIATRWHLSPVDGEGLLRDITRLRAAAGLKGSPADLMHRGEPFEVAGNLASPMLPAELAQPPAPQTVPCRTVRLDGDPRPADAHLPGPPLWRRAEPGNDPALASLLADDIAAWVRACAG